MHLHFPQHTRPVSIVFNYQIYNDSNNHLFFRMNCLVISDDSTLVAGGFSESYIKIWHLKGKKLKSKAEVEQGNILMGQLGKIKLNK